MVVKSAIIPDSEPLDSRGGLALAIQRDSLQGTLWELGFPERMETEGLLAACANASNTAGRPSASIRPAEPGSHKTRSGPIRPAEPGSHKTRSGSIRPAEPASHKARPGLPHIQVSSSS